jgi:peptidoglycan/xylan/chitin deacetylase (PgdA/CDA1 family)
MPRRLFGLTAAVALACVLSACSAGATPIHRTASTPSGPPVIAGSPSPSVAPSSPAAPTTHPPTHKPKPPTTRPSPKSTGAPGTVSAADLGIPGAGTLKIPAWPNQAGMRYRGPYGSQGSTGTTSVALTFDDGPGPYTSQVLDLLDSYHVKATFCLIGEQIHNYKAVILRMIDDGMTLCDHTWDHDEKLGTHNAQYIAKDMQRTIDAVHAIDAAAQVTYFRNPGGNFTPGTVRICELLGMRPLYWNEDTEDWTRPGTAAIEHSLLTQTHRDSIVLMHDAGGDRTETIAALKAELSKLKSEFHLIALPTARTVTINPGTPAPPSSPSPAISPTPADPAIDYRAYTGR